MAKQINVLRDQRLKEAKRQLNESENILKGFDDPDALEKIVPMRLAAFRAYILFHEAMGNPNSKLSKQQRVLIRKIEDQLEVVSEYSDNPYDGMDEPNPVKLPFTMKQFRATRVTDTKRLNAFNKLLDKDGDELVDGARVIYDLRPFGAAPVYFFHVPGDIHNGAWQIQFAAINEGCSTRADAESVMYRDVLPRYWECLTSGDKRKPRC